MKVKKEKSVLKTVIKVLAIVLAVLVCLCLFIRFRGAAAQIKEYDSENGYILPCGEALVSAHRSGTGVFPENTMLAFEGCVQSEDFNVDVFEFDLHITKDDVLILLHDGTLERTTDAAEYFGKTDNHPEDYTYEELRALNFGETFTTDDGEMPYAGLRGDKIPDSLRVTRLEDVLDYLESNQPYRYIIEIKNSGELGYKSADILYSVLKEKNLLDRALIGTFNNEVTAYMDESYPDMGRSAGVNEVVKMWLNYLFGIKHEVGYYPFTALQIPTGYWIIRLDSVGFINYTHEHGVAVQFWTIDDFNEMQKLVGRNADCIITNYPARAYNLLNP